MSSSIHSLRFKILIILNLFFTRENNRELLTELFMKRSGRNPIDFQYFLASYKFQTDV